jgi:transcriptional regulator with XRE-family HTH domain
MSPYSHQSTDAVGVNARGPVATALGQRIVLLRREKGWSQEHLAYVAGVHRTYMGGIERGERNPSLFNLFKIAKALEVSLRDLFE